MIDCKRSPQKSDRFLFILANRRFNKSEMGTKVCLFRRSWRLWIYNNEVSDRD
ncbi:hypothetical protein [Coleofasciculus sp. H7-2]|uniref:hypothetical protein n=1 Tax=Coleofasciculus sp. H7-2 TaxID=3351545 RepID=UPI00367213AF